MAVITTFYPSIYALHCRIFKHINYSITRSDAGFYAFIPFMSITAYAHDMGESITKLKLILIQLFDRFDARDDELKGIEERQRVFISDHIGLQNKWE